MVCHPVKNAFNIPFEQLQIGSFIANGAAGKVRLSSNILDIGTKDMSSLVVAQVSKGTFAGKPVAIKVTAERG